MPRGVYDRTKTKGAKSGAKKGAKNGAKKVKAGKTARAKSSAQSASA